MLLYDPLPPTIIKQIRDSARGCIKTLKNSIGDCPAISAVANQWHAYLLESFAAGEGWILPDLDRLFAAERFSIHCHHGHYRKDVGKTPYIIHPLQVATILFNVGHVRDPDVLIAALLHDTVEDTPVTLQEIEERFGKKVKEFVAAVSDDPDLDWHSRKHMQIHTAKALSAGAAQIKLADKYCNLRDIAHSAPRNWSPERIDGYVKWAQAVIERLPWVNAPLLAVLLRFFHEYDKKRGLTST